MMYPYIYSLSTVGIIKHYIHDYHFHDKRTDIVGPNGVGKSVLADLLQLIFIFEPNMVRFGTDGMNKEKREIRTLPYKSRYAYAFINVEAKKGLFLTLGVQINSQQGKVLTPFLITREADFEQRSDNVFFTEEKLLYARDLIVQNVISGLDELSDHISENFGLKLNVFRTKEEINRYYKALYQKEILPLDLSQEKSLKAYAKVIQSFSKVKTLNLGGDNISKNLKDFLFEETDSDIKTQFEINKSKFEKFLDDYRQLDEDISLWSEKQKYLQDSVRLFKDCEKKHRRYLGAVVNDLSQTIKCHESQIHRLEIDSQREQKRKDIKQNRLFLIANVKSIIENTIHKIKRQEDLLENSRGLMNELNQADEQLALLQEFDLPSLTEEWLNHPVGQEWTIPSVPEVCRAIKHAIQFFTRYKSMEELLHQRDHQRETLEKLKNEVMEKKKTVNRLLELLAGKNDSSVMGWFLKQSNNLSSEQIHAILHFAVLPVSQPDEGLGIRRYLDMEPFIEEFDFSSEKNGGWLKLGALREYIPFTEDAELLKRTTTADVSIGFLKSRLERDLSVLEGKLEAIRHVHNGGEVDKELLQLDIDVQIVEYSAITSIKRALYYIKKIPAIEGELKGKCNILQQKIISLKQELEVSGSTMDDFRKQLVKKREKWNNRNSLCGRTEVHYETDIEAAELLLIRISGDIRDATRKLSETRLNLESTMRAYTSLFDEEPQITEEPYDDLKLLSIEYENAREAYKRHYITTSAHFNETKDGKNVDVQMEITSSSLSFAVLERALLGNRVKATDDIVEALKEANATRSSMADGISDEMLKVFNLTVARYDLYKSQIQRINGFFVDRKISGHFYFKVDFEENKVVSIEHVKDISVEMRMALMQGALGVTESIVSFIENSFHKKLNLKTKIPFDDLLNPKTYFELSARLTDEFGVEVPGSTGETYSAIALLGIARLSLSQKEPRNGLRFLILEELGSLDNTNFNTFPAIAQEFKYQIITMAPHNFNIGFSDQWYAHYLIKGISDKNINHFPSSSFFKTPLANEKLSIYLKRQRNELASVKSAE